MINIKDDRILEQYNENEIFLLLWIAKRMCSNKTAWPSLSTLEKDTRWSKSKILRVRKSLEEKGALKTERRERENKSYTSNEYEVLLPEIEPRGGWSQNDTRVVSKPDKGSAKARQAVVSKEDKKEKGIKKKKKRKEEGKESTVRLCSFDECLATLQSLNQSGSLGNVDEQTLEEIATTFVSKEMTLDPSNDDHVKGLRNWAKKYIENLPKRIPGESINMVEEVSTLFTKHMIRIPSERIKKAMCSKIWQLMKSGETLDDFEQAFQLARASHGDVWKDFEYTINNYKRLKTMKVWPAA